MSALHNVQPATGAKVGTFSGIKFIQSSIFGFTFAHRQNIRPFPPATLNRRNLTNKPVRFTTDL